MTTFVLLPGAFRGGWSWDRVADELTDAGHRAEAVDLVGEDDLGRSDLGLDLLVGRARDAVVGAEREAGKHVVLCGHSFGGLVAIAVASRERTGAMTVVAVDAPMPRDGQRAIDIRPPSVPAPPDLDRASWIDPRPVEAGAGLDQVDADWINERLRSEPVGPSLDPIEIPDDGGNPCVAHLFFDRTPPGYSVTVTRHEVESSAAPTAVIDAGHDAIVSHPTQVAAAIIDLSERAAR